MTANEEEGTFSRVFVVCVFDDGMLLLYRLSYKVVGFLLGVAAHSDK